MLWNWNLTYPLRVLSQIYDAEEKLNLLHLAHLKVCEEISQLNHVWFTIMLMGTELDIIHYTLILLYIVLISFTFRSYSVPICWSPIQLISSASESFYEK